MHKNEVYEQVQFYILDSPYDDLSDEITFQVSKDYSLLTDFIVFYASWITKIRSGFYYTEVRPIESITKVTVPILFIHGESDRTMPVEMSQNLYKAKPSGIKELWIVPEADHLQSYNLAPDEYIRKLNQFLHEVQ